MPTPTKRRLGRQKPAQRPADPAWFSVHTHTHKSVLDATTEVGPLVQRAVEYGYPAMGFTDHGNMAACTDGYLQCRAAGIKFFPGVELYLVDPEYTGSIDDKEFATQERFHLCMWARTFDGYKALVELVSRSHTRPRFNRFPRVTWDDLVEIGAAHGDDLIVSTGCYFGYVQQRLVKGGIEEAARAVKAYASLFPNLFVELQHHNIDHSTTAEPSPWDDTAVVEALLTIADVSGLPVMATQDSHYLDTKNRTAHGLMKRMVYGGADDAFPGDSFHLASEDWVAEHYPPDVWSRCLDGAQQFLNLHDLKIPLLDKFTPQVPTVTDENGDPIDAEAYLMEKAWLRLEEIAVAGKWGTKRRQTAEDRMEHERSIISDLGMFGYFAVVDDYLRFCDDNDIAVEARGSANASFLCYLWGITQVDPIEWGLLFERFLSRDRTKPPDVDMDVEQERHAELIAYISRRWGGFRIGTFGALGETTENGVGTGKGSVLVSYTGWAARDAEAQVKAAAEALGATANANDIKRARSIAYARLQSIDSVREFAPADYEPLRQLSEMKVHRNYGQHPGGVLLPADGIPVADVIPTMLVASSDSTVTQYDMDAVENWGFLKLDILSQATLTVMKLCQQYMGRAQTRDFSWIPKNDRDALKLLREGRTNTGIFHFEGYTKAKGGRELGVKSTADAVLATALYMPGAMESGQKDRVVRMRRDTDARSRIKYLHPIYKTHLEATHGAVVYQEQVMQVWIDLGMSVASANAVLKVMKTSGSKSVGNHEKIAKLRAEFDACCEAHGITDTDAAWNGTAGFASYGFNKAHAAGYGIRSYRCAYLKAHHPVEFMLALLTVQAGTDKEPLYVREARRMQVRITSADVNTSGITWSRGEGRNTIVRGMVSIKGIGPAAATELHMKGPFRDIDDLASRVSPSRCSGGQKYITTGLFTGDLLKLKMAGALRSLGIGPTD